MLINSQILVHPIMNKSKFSTNKKTKTFCFLQIFSANLPLIRQEQSHSLGISEMLLKLGKLLLITKGLGEKIAFFIV